MATIQELIAQGLFKFSFNDMKCEPVSSEPITWEEFENSCDITWEVLECDSLSSKTYEQLECSGTAGLLAWNNFTCESAQEIQQGVIYFLDTIDIKNDCE